MGNNFKSHRLLLLLQAIVLPLAAIFISLTWASTAQVSIAQSSSKKVLQAGNPVPVLTAISPTQVIAGSGSFTLTVTGSSFITETVIRMKFAPLATTFVSSTQLLAYVPAEYISTYQNSWIQVYTPLGGASASLPFLILPKSRIYLPNIINQFPPIPGTPVLNGIDNSDQDNSYVVSWQNPGYGNSYVLDESLDDSFSQPVAVYQGPNLSWAVPAGGKLPATYYYRVKTITQYGESPWSNVQSVRIYPLFVGLKVRYDGVGFIRGSEYYDIGWHETINLDALTDADTIQAQFYDWYDPDPLYFGDSSSTSYYSVTTGDWKSSSIPDDPSWKWGASWKLAYDATFTDGSTIMIDGQKFTVSGPTSGYTIYGKPISYWEFVNQDKFLFYDGGSDWTQYVKPGKAILRYDAGSSGLLIYDNITRQYYYQGDETNDTVQYISNVSAANSLPGSPPVEPGSIANRCDRSTPGALDSDNIHTKGSLQR